MGSVSASGIVLPPKGGLAVGGSSEEQGSCGEDSGGGVLRSSPLF